MWARTFVLKTNLNSAYPLGDKTVQYIIIRWKKSISKVYNKNIFILIIIGLEESFTWIFAENG